jgi:hypothetical protein
MKDRMEELKSTFITTLEMLKNFSSGGRLFEKARGLLVPDPSYRKYIDPESLENLA